MLKIIIWIVLIWIILSIIYAVVKGESGILSPFIKEIQICFEEKPAVTIIVGIIIVIILWKILF